MPLHYRFIHACGHTGIGPLIPGRLDGSSQYSPLPTDNENITTIRLDLPFSCPFCPVNSCDASHATSETPLGHGILTIFSLTCPWSWHIIRSCSYDEITEADWAHSVNANGGFRQMAWIPRPCGEVRVTREPQEVNSGAVVHTGSITDVSCAWKQTIGDEVESRFAGLLSQLNAAILSGKTAGR